MCKISSPTPPLPRQALPSPPGSRQGTAPARGLPAQPAASCTSSCCRATSLGTADGKRSLKRGFILPSTAFPPKGCSCRDGKANAFFFYYYFFPTSSSSPAPADSGQGVIGAPKQPCPARSELGDSWAAFEGTDGEIIPLPCLPALFAACLRKARERLGAALPLPPRAAGASRV